MCTGLVMNTYALYPYIINWSHALKSFIRDIVYTKSRTNNENILV